MGLLDRLFKKTDTQKESSYIDSITSTNIPTQYTPIQRDDGSTIYIAPQTDSMGYQVYSQIYNAHTNMQQLIPKFFVISDELRDLMPNNINASILLDIDPNILQNPYYSSQVANVLLNAERMSKVIKQYHSYAGGLEYDQNGYVVGKYVDQAIITSLGMTKQQRDEAMEKYFRDSHYAQQAEIIDMANHTPVNIDNNQPVILHADMLNNNNNNNSHDSYDGYR